MVTNMSNTVPWGLWITIDLSAIALGAGAFTLSAIVYLFGLKRFQSIVRLAVFVGFIGYTSALLTLVMDIGRPDRFWHPWAYWNVHSVLWEITWCITIYLMIMVFEFLPVIAELQVLRPLAACPRPGPHPAQGRAVPGAARPGDLAAAPVVAGRHLRHRQSPGHLVQAEHADHVHPLGRGRRPGRHHGDRLRGRMGHQPAHDAARHPAHDRALQRVRAVDLPVHQAVGPGGHDLLRPNAFRSARPLPTWGTRPRTGLASGSPRS